MIVIKNDPPIMQVAYFGLRTDHPRERIIIDRYRATLVNGELLHDSETNLGPIEFPQEIKVNPTTGAIYHPTEEAPDAPSDYISAYDFCKLATVGSDPSATIWAVTAAMIEGFMQTNGMVPEAES